MFHIILFEPEIPPNAGNIIRLSVNTGCNLHLIEPLGFSIDEKSFKRAGMDYMNKKDFQVWDSLETCTDQVRADRYFTVSTKGKNYTQILVIKKETLLFLVQKAVAFQSKLDDSFESVYIPMKSEGRSLNLANAVSIIVYEAWKRVKIFSNNPLSLFPTMLMI